LLFRSDILTKTKIFFLSMCDVKVFLTFGADLTTVLPVLFKYCCKYCYSDSRKWWSPTHPFFLVRHMSIAKKSIHNGLDFGFVTKVWSSRCFSCVYDDTISVGFLTNFIKIYRHLIHNPLIASLYC
jgi:hypothetical protein